MTGLVYSDRYHTYHLNGERLPSVTQILSVIHKPGLDRWRGDKGNAEADRISKEAGEHGTAVHAACEAIAKGLDTLVSYPPGIMEPAEAFYTWFYANAAEVLACETRLASVTHRYAGTVDLVVRLMTGDVAVIDLKTSSVVDPSFALQIEAYRQALLEQDGIEATRRLVIHMPRKTPGKLDVLEFPPDEALHDWRAFLSASIIWHRLFAAAAFGPRKPLVARAGVRA